MRLFVLTALPLLMALNACGVAPSSVGERRAAEREAEERVLAAYRAVQTLETTRPETSATTLSLYRPWGGVVDAGFLELVNSTVNQAPWKSDPDLYGAIDYWAQPSEFFAKGGDCEDFAMAKMAILRDAGVPERAMGVEVLKRDDGRGHAVLVVTLDGQDWVLDNLEDRLIPYGRYPGQGYYRIGFGSLKVFGPASPRAPTPAVR